jgi:hypothetical protein
MSDPTYSFLPWLRSGVANSITSADGDTSVKLRAALALEVTISGAKIDGGSDDEVVKHDISLFGPGDIVGIDRRAVVKVEPRDWVTNFESNYLPYIDFYDEDFPWRYTPAAANVAKHRLRPWITLVVLEEQVEFHEGKDRAGKPLPYFELAAGVDAAKIFPRADELWAWAHVHVNVDLSANGDPAIGGALDKLRATLAQNPDLAYARLMCPRQLEPNKSYHAFVIPTFESGRLAGLGLPVPDSLVATQSAWGSGATQFPIYHRWFFKTGAFGDFEYLVRLLVPRPVDTRVGVRDIDVLHAGSGLPPIATPASLGGVLKLGGALRVPFDTMSPDDQAKVTAFDQWDVPFPHEFETAMAALVNLADDYQRAAPSDVNPDGDPDPIVTLPLYGRWPALVDRLLTAADGGALPNQQNWIHRLNLDPRWRVAGGLGTEVVQHNDQKYMAAAWQQVGDVISANNRLRLAQLLAALSRAMHEVHVASIEPARQFVLTSPVHPRILGSATTVAALLRASVVPPAVTSGVFRRVTRRGTALSARLGLAHGAAAQIVTRINDREIHPAPPMVAPPGAIKVSDADKVIRPAGEPAWLEKLLERYPWLALLPPLLLLLVIALIGALFGLFAAVLAGTPGIALAIWLWNLLRTWARAARLEHSISEESQTPASVAELPMSSDFVITTPGTELVPREDGSDSTEAARFKDGLRDVYTFTQHQFAEPVRPSLELPRLTRTVVAALHPSVTLPRRIKTIIHLPGRIADDMVETFTPCMAYPVFDQPMYKPLSDLSAEMFLPNINLIPSNSLTLLESNDRFIESYMVGLNHEMARELLWNEFPTDQRGSYFRQFWDVHMILPPDPTPAQKEAVRDIAELHTWPRASALGTHDPRHGAALLVLVIRGELLKRYPTAVIYAQKAAWQTTNGAIDTTKDRVLVNLLPSEETSPPSSKIRVPLFEAKVDPDIYFIGFDLSAKLARGGTTASDDPGWFFVIKERPGEPRFGMDDTVPGPNKPRLVNWNDLTWSDVGTAPGAPITLDKTIGLVHYDPNIDLENKKIEDDAQAQWNPDVDAAELAYILYRVPVLCAVHASRMLPS